MMIPDLAPSLPSRLVTIEVVEPGEDAPGSGEIEFCLPYDLHLPESGRIVQAGVVRARLADGRATVRLPAYTTAAVREDGSTDWVIVVWKSWGGKYAVRVPAGSEPVALAELPSVRPLARRESYPITGVGLTVTEADQTGGSVALHDGILDFTLQVTPFDPATVYPYIEQTVDGEVSQADAQLRADLSKRIAWVQAAYDWAIAHGYQGSPADWETSGLPKTWAWGDITGKPTTWPWNNVSGKPTTFPPAPHSHTIDDVDGLREDLDDLAADTGWTAANLEMGSGWTMPAGATYVGPWLPLRYRVRAGHVTVSGYLKKGSAATAGEPMCRLPAGARPTRALANTGGGGTITDTGNVLCPEANAQGLVAVYITGPVG